MSDMKSDPVAKAIYLATLAASDGNTELALRGLATVVAYVIANGDDGTDPVAGDIFSIALANEYTAFAVMRYAREQADA